jgi:glycine hydroxymethyltransferase
METLQIIDPTILSLIQKETERQNLTINLIASENYVDQAVLQALASVLTNKYAEGYPGKRYYSGCNVIDEVEMLAQERCKKLFGTDHANVQPHAGSPANLAVYFSVLKPGDTILGMSLAEGGHLTHGHSVNFSGSIYNAISYAVNPETEELDYDAIDKLAHIHKPKLIIAGASAYSRTIDFKRFADIAQEVGALFMADIAHIAGLIATGLHPTPVGSADFITSTTHKTLRGPRGGLIMCKKEHAERIDRAIMPGIQGGPFMNVIAAKAVAFAQALQPDFKVYQQQVIANAKRMACMFQERGYRIVAGGTDNHLFIIDLRSKNITGKEAEVALEKAGINVSRSCIPFDPAKPWITSGIRIGTPAITTRGMKDKEVEKIVDLIDEALTFNDNDQKLSLINKQARELCLQFPIYSNL